MNENEKLMSAIEETLSDYDICKSLAGYRFAVKVLEMLYSDPNAKIGDFYNTVAFTHDSNYMRVERAIRYAFRKAAECKVGGFDKDELIKSLENIKEILEVQIKTLREM